MYKGAIFVAILNMCMNLLYRFFLIVCMASVAAACNRDAVCGEQTERRAVVTIDCSGSFGVDVRTFVEGQLSNGDLEIGWDESDRFRLWSFKSSDGTPATSGVDFALYHHDMTFPVARFKGQVDLAAYNAGDTYNYYAVSPVPASPADVQGTRVSYTLPAVQTGEFDGSLDILTAQLLNAPALAEDHNPDIRLQFQHQVHVLRIIIPENRMGEDIRAMELSFPGPVVGRLTVDATGASDPVLADGNSVVRLNFAEPKQVGDVVYVTIAPTTIPKEGVISMRIMGRTGETSTDCLGGVERTMAAGHFSPIELRVPTMKVHYTILTFRLPADLGVNTLGEKVNKVKITPSGGGSLAGATLPDDSKLTSTELTYDISSAEVRNDGVYYTIILMPDVAGNIVAGLNGKALTATFESERAWNLTHTVACETLALNGDNTFRFEIPYLFYEDFSDMTETAEWDSNYGTSVAGTKSGHRFHGLWSGARCGVSAGKSIRLACRRETSARYPARVDSAPLSCIRSGIKVSVEFSFNWSMSQQKGGLWSKNVGQTCDFGYTDDSNNTIHNSDVGDFTHKESFFMNSSTSGGSYDNIRNTQTVSMDNCSSISRLSWRTINESVAGMNNNTLWFYIDNVKVKLK